MYDKFGMPIYDALSGDADEYWERYAFWLDPQQARHFNHYSSTLKERLWTIWGHKQYRRDYTYPDLRLPISARYDVLEQNKRKLVRRFKLMPPPRSQHQALRISSNLLSYLNAKWEVDHGDEDPILPIAKSHIKDLHM